MGCSIRSDRRVIDVTGEYAARLAFEEEGLCLLDINWRGGRRGELDIIVCDEADPSRSRTVIVEVRIRVGCRKGSTFAPVDHRKVARLRALMGAWCRVHDRLALRVCIDVVAIIVNARTLESRLAPADEAVDLRALGAQVAWLRGVQ